MDCFGGGSSSWPDSADFHTFVAHTLEPGRRAVGHCATLTLSLDGAALVARDVALVPQSSAGGGGDICKTVRRLSLYTGAV